MSFGLVGVVDAAAAKSKRRFNLLMLEDREYYFQDYGGFMHVSDEGVQTAVPFSHRRRIKGRIHVCSKNLVFDPDDQSINILRLPLRDIASLKPRRALDAGNQEYLVVHTRCAVEIPFHTPYVFHKLDLATPQSEYVLSLSFVELSTFLALVQQLHGLYRLPTNGDGPGTKAHALQELIRAREEKIPFESSCIVDIREKPLLPGGQAILAQQVLPLLLCPGRFQLTDARIYFQSFNAISATETLVRVEVDSIRRVYKRRFVMRDTALELFIAPPPARGLGAAAAFGASAVSSSSATTSSPLSQSSVYFNFSSPAVRDAVYTLLCTACPRFTAASSAQSLSSMMAAWVRGELSNFDYLLFLNQHAGRSWLDLTQYPVFPWVLSDYTSATLNLDDPSVYRDLSKPIGALNPSRLEGFRRRMRDMPPEIHHGHPFLYGTHFSTPGYVLYYLVRRAPAYMLKLQNGSYDKPDRLFSSIASSWKSVLEAPTDVKELLPEFFATEAELSAAGASSAKPGDFLVNSLELDLGHTQTGREISDVELPPWSRGSPREFVRLNRAALEHPHVSAHLHEWIDLIFGSKQRGEAARQHENLFYHLTYPGAVELDKLDPRERKGIELQINEFGQMPTQIFVRDHPKRFGDFDQEAEAAAQAAVAAAASSTAAASAPATAAASSSADDLSADGSVLPAPFSLPSLIATDLTRMLSDDGSEAPAESPDGGGGSSKLFTFVPMSNSPVSTALPVGQSLSSLVMPPLSRTAADMELLEQRTQALQLAAEVDNIQTKQLRLDDDFSLTSPNGAGAAASASSTRAAPAPATAAPVPRGGQAAWNCMHNDGWRRLDVLSLHRDAVTCVSYAAGGNLVSVSADGHLKVYSIGPRKLIRSAKVSDLTLSACAATPDGKQVYVSSWDNTVSLYNLSFGRVVSAVQAHDDAVSAMSVSGARLLTGSWDTTLRVFAVSESAIAEQPLATFAEHEAAITAVALDGAATTAVSGGEDGMLCLWDVRVRDGHARTVEGFDCPVRALAFSPQAKWGASADFVVAGADCSLRHMDAGSGRVMSRLPTRGASLHALTTDGSSVLAAGEDGFVRGWDLRTCEEVMSLDGGMGGGPLVSLTTNEDASLLAAAGQRMAIWRHDSASD